MTPEEQQALASQALQSYNQPQSGWDPAIADHALQSYAAPPPPTLPPVDQAAIAEAALQGVGAKPPGLSPEDQRVLGNAALTGYGAPPPQGLTPGPVSDAQLLHPQATTEAAQEESAAYLARSGGQFDNRAPEERAASAEKWAQGAELAAQSTNPNPTDAGPPAAALAAVPPSAVAANTAPEGMALPPPVEQPSHAPLPVPRNLNQAIDNLTEESNRDAQAEKERAAVEYQGLAATAGLSKEQAADVAARQQRHIAALDEQQRGINQLRDEMKAANETAEASSHFEHKETTRSAIAGVLALTGGMLADGFARMGGNNQTRYMQEAQAGLDKAVEMDLAQQRERYNNDKESAKAKKDELSIAINLFGKTPEADEFARILTDQRYNTEMASQLASSKADSVKAGGKVLEEAAHTKTALDIANLMAGVQRARLSAGRGAAKDNKRYSAKELYERRLKGEELTTTENALATAYEDDQRAAGVVATRAELAADKAAEAHEQERAEVVDGLVQRPGMVKMNEQERKNLREHFTSAAGVTFLADKAARLWDVVLDKKEQYTKEERMAARAEYEGIRENLLTGASVDQGQGAITKSDAERTGDVLPKLPLEMDLGNIGRYVQNLFKGQTADSETLRRIALNAYDQQYYKLYKTYGIVPREEGLKLWAKHDEEREARKAAAKAQVEVAAGGKPKGETAPPPKKGETKPALAPVPEGKVALIRVSDGKRLFASPEAAKREMAKSPDAYRME